jgi:hypothetical protein
MNSIEPPIVAHYRPPIALHVFNDFGLCRSVFQDYSTKWSDQGGTANWGRMVIHFGGYVHHFMVISRVSDLDKVNGMEIAALFPHESWRPESEEVPARLLSRVRPVK